MTHELMLGAVVLCVVTAPSGVAVPPKYFSLNRSTVLTLLLLMIVTAN